MHDNVIDCCSLINLFTGWGGLAELAVLERNWHVCDAVLGEAEYTRDYGPDGAVQWIPLELGPFTQQGILIPAHPDSEGEIQDYVEFASEVDDGEAQALAIAKNRGYALLTDDHKAAKIAQRADVAVEVISTPTVLRWWAARDTANDARLREVVRRISLLARFNPRVDSPDYDWWRGLLED